MLTIEPIFNTSLRFQKMVMRGLYIVLFGYCFAIPIMVPFVENILGSSSNFFYLVMVASITGLVLGVPISMLADAICRKSLIILGLGISGSGWLLLSLAPEGNEYWLAVAFFIRAIGSSMTGTSLAPYFLDILEKKKKECEYAREESIATTYSNFAMIFITLLSGYLFEQIIHAPFVANTFLNFLFCIILLLWMPSTQKIHHESNTEKLYHTPIARIRPLITINSFTLWLIIAGGAWFTVSNYIPFIYQARLVEINLSPMWIAVFFLLSIYLEVSEHGLRISFRTEITYYMHSYFSFFHCFFSSLQKIYGLLHFPLLQPVL